MGELGHVPYGGTIRLPPGDIPLDAVQSIAAPHTRIAGVGPATRIIGPTSGSGAVLSLDADDILLENVTLVPRGSFWGEMVAVNGNGCRLHGVGVDGSQATSGFGTSILVNGEDCYIEAPTLDLGTQGWTGIISSGAGTTIRDARIAGGRAYGIDARSKTGTGRGLRVHGGRIVGTAAHSVIAWNSHAHIGDGLLIERPGGVGVFLTGDPEGGMPNEGSRVCGVTVVDGQSHGIDCEWAVSGFTVSGNTIIGPAGNGISMIREVTDGQVVNNVVLRARGTYGGIACPRYGATNTSARLLIDANTVVGSTRYGVHLEDGDSSFIGKSNRLHGNTAGPTQIAATDVTNEHAVAS